MQRQTEIDWQELEECILNGLERGRNVYLPRAGGFLVTLYPHEAHDELLVWNLASLDSEALRDERRWAEIAHSEALRLRETYESLLHH